MPTSKAAGKRAVSKRRGRPDDSGNEHKRCAAFLVSRSKLIRLAGKEAVIRVSSARGEAIKAGFDTSTINCVLQGGAFSGPIPGCNGADTYVVRLGSLGIQDLLNEFMVQPDAGTEQNQGIINGIQRLLGDLAK